MCGLVRHRDNRGHGHGNTAGHRAGPNAASGNGNVTEEWLTGMLAVGAPQVFQMNAAAAGWLGRMYETLVLLHFVITDQRAKGVATGSDLAIAAIAIAANAAVASSNVKHFLQIHAVFPLPGLFDPMDQMWHVQVKPPS